jgi:hypothetical protein
MYDLHILGWHSFQQLCLTIARESFGQTVESFLDSSDAGKDGAFAGTWESSKGEALTGRFVIQCKFTSKIDKTLSRSDFTDHAKKAKRLVKSEHFLQEVLRGLDEHSKAALALIPEAGFHAIHHS